MIPILYKQTETNFGHLGLGQLAEARSCVVTEERNGIYELELLYPATGLLFSELKNGAIIKAKPNDTSTDQKFAIYSVGKVTNGVVTIKAHHCSYDLMGNPLKSDILKGNRTPGAAMTEILGKTVHPHTFTAWSDISSVVNYELKVPALAREALGGMEGSILDRFKGEFEFDNDTIKLHKVRGKDNGVIVAYGKNIVTAEQEESINETYTSIYPFAQINSGDGGTTLITLPEYILNSENAGAYRVNNTLMQDFSYDETVKDVATLRTAAQSYLDNNKLGVPKVNLIVSFANLWQTENYKDVAMLERVSLCDTVSVYFDPLQINVKAKVIRTVFNTLLERYDEIELGEPSTNLASQIGDVEQRLDEKIDGNKWLEDAYNDLTNTLNSAPPGNIVIYPSLSNPQEILIMDTNNIDTARNVWRWNAGGLGHSKTGYKGLYTLGMTYDGKIVADMITTGILKAIDIVGVTITGSAAYLDTLYSSFMPPLPLPQYREILQIGGGVGFSISAKKDSKPYPALQMRMNTTGDLGMAIEAVNENTGVVNPDKVIRISPHAGVTTPIVQSIGWVAIATPSGGKVSCITAESWDTPSLVYIDILAKAHVSMSSALIKQDIEKFSDSKTAEKYTAKQMIKTVEVFSYRLKQDVETAFHEDDEDKKDDDKESKKKAYVSFDKKMGFIAETLPPELRADDLMAMDMQKTIMWLWQYARENEEDKAVQDKRIDDLEELLYATINELEQERNKLTKLQAILKKIRKGLRKIGFTKITD